MIRAYSQSKTSSFIEAWVNILIGFLIAWLVQEIIFPYYGIHISSAANFQILVWFTVISLARSFILRRVFNAWTCR